MIADLLWIFPGLKMAWIESREIDELMAWHARALLRKRADLEAAGLTAQVIGQLFAAR